jgi:hypothetical protein
VPSWNDILNEINTTQDDPVLGNRFDQVRRKYLTALAAHTGRHTILYAVRWLQGVPPGGESLVSISDEDIQGLMATVQGHKTNELDLILHSPGGSPEAAESIVHYLRSKFTHIRVVVPQLAMSAATMIACAANRVLMGKHSSLGPTDPQLFLNTPLGPRLVPAQAIIEQFELAKSECRDPALLRAWAPILPQYGPDILVTCENASKLSRELVRQWLAKYMLAHLPARRRGEIVRRCAAYLTSHKKHATHGRHIDRETLRSKGMQIDDLEIDPIEQDLVLSIYHATTICFSTLGHVAKLIENHEGKAFIKATGVATPFPFPFGPGRPPGFPPVPAPAPQPPAQPAAPPAAPAPTGP